MTPTEPDPDGKLCSVYNKKYAYEWLMTKAFPFWAANGIDYQNGGVHEALDYSGIPVDLGYKRSRVLSRQIYSFSKAKVMGWDGNADSILDHCFNTLISTGWHRNGGIVHRFNTDGSVQDETRMLYDQSFALLGFAAYFKAVNNHEARKWSDQVLKFLDADLVDEVNGGYFETPERSGNRTANSHMHFLEAMLEWYETTGEEEYLTRAKSIMSLFRERFFDEENWRIHEFLDDEWAPLDFDSNRVDPGHHYEWIWLLLRYAHLSTDETVLQYVRKIFATAYSFGHFLETDSVALSIRFDGSNPSPDARLWSQTEALKAALSIEKLELFNTGNLKSRMLNLIFGKYLATPAIGGWHDAMDQNGQFISHNMPSSSFYHIVCAIGELSKGME